MFERNLEPARIEVSVTNLLELQPSAAERLSSNVLNPVYNILVAQPVNAVLSSADDTAKIFNKSVVSFRLAEATIPKSTILSPDWIMQNVATGIASVATLATIQLVTRSGLNSVGLRVGNAASLIIGGTLYEAAKQPGEHQTRLGNATGAIAMLSIFEGGNHLAKKMSATPQLLTRALTGAGGGFAHVALASYVSTGEVHSRDLVSTLTTGALTNALLPIVQARLIGDGPVRSATSAETAVSKGAPEAPLGKIEGRLKPGSDSALKPTGEVLELDFVQLGENGAEAQCRQHLMVRLETATLRDSTLIKIPKGFSPQPRLQPGELAAVLETMPDHRLIKEIVVSDYPHPRQSEVTAATGSSTAVIRASTDSIGFVKLYKPVAGDELARSVAHEYGHNLKTASGKPGELFDKVAHLERATLAEASSHPFESPGEAWSRLSERILGPNQAEGYLAAHASPIATSLFTRALRKAVTAPGAFSTNAGRYVSFIDYVERHINPVARKTLSSVGSADAAEVLQFLSTPIK